MFAKQLEGMVLSSFSTIT